MTLVPYNSNRLTILIKSPIWVIFCYQEWGETIVWQQIEGILKDPALILKGIEKQLQDANQLDVLEPELQQVERQLKLLDRKQQQLLQWALKGFPEETVVSENKRINQNRLTLQRQKGELDTQIKTSQEATVNLPKLERFVELTQDKISVLDFEGKRQVKDTLGIKVWLNDENIEISGILPIEDVIVITQSRLHSHNNIIPFSVKVGPT